MVVFAGFINLFYHIKLSISKLSLFTPSLYDLSSIASSQERKN